LPSVLYAFKTVTPVPSEVMPSDASKSQEYVYIPLSSVEALPLNVTNQPVIAALSKPASATGGSFTWADVMLTVNFGLWPASDHSEL